MTTFRSAGLPCPGAGSICRLGGAGGVSGVEEGFSRGEEGGGRRASTPPWWRGSPGTAAAQPVGSIESTGRETSPSRQVCSIPPAQLSLGSSDVKKTSPLVEPAPPLSLPHACCEIIIQTYTYSCNAKIPKRLRSLSSIVDIYKIRPVQ